MKKMLVDIQTAYYLLSHTDEVKEPCAVAQEVAETMDGKANAAYLTATISYHRTAHGEERWDRLRDAQRMLGGAAQRDPRVHWKCHDGCLKLSRVRSENAHRVYTVRQASCIPHRRRKRAYHHDTQTHPGPVSFS